MSWCSKGAFLLVVTELAFDVFLQLQLTGPQCPALLLLQQASGVLEGVPGEACPGFLPAAFASPDPFGSSQVSESYFDLVPQVLQAVFFQVTGFLPLFPQEELFLYELRNFPLSSLALFGSGSPRQHLSKSLFAFLIDDVPQDVQIVGYAAY